MKEFCKICNNELDENSECAVCNSGFSDDSAVSGENEDWVVVHLTSDEFNASFITANLNRAEIPAQILSQTRPFIFSELAIIKVMVPPEFKEEAENIIKEIENGDFSIPEKNDG